MIPKPNSSQNGVLLVVDWNWKGSKMSEGNMSACGCGPLQILTVPVFASLCGADHKGEHLGDSAEVLEHSAGIALNQDLLFLFLAKTKGFEFA